MPTWLEVRLTWLSISSLLAVVSSKDLTSANSLLAWVKAACRALRVASHFRTAAWPLATIEDSDMLGL